MNRQRRLIMRLCGLANAVPQLAAALVLCLLAASTANAQLITGLPGSPDATVTINGRQLPPPPMPFGGVIKESAKDYSRAEYGAAARQSAGARRQVVRRQVM